MFFPGQEFFVGMVYIHIAHHNIKQVILAIVSAYREIKWDEAELEKSDSLLSLPPKEGCDIALHMFEAFLHMGPDMGPRAYRFVMLDGNKYYRLQK